MSKPVIRATPVVRPRRRIRKRTVTLALAATMVIGVVGAYFSLATASTRMLRHAQAEADRLDPGWRLAEIEVKREAVPDAENSAPQVARVVALMPASWPPPSTSAAAGQAPEDFVTRISQVAPDVRLPGSLVAEAR